MKRIEKRPPQAMELVYRGLIVVAAVLVLVLIIGTIYGLAKRGKPQTAGASAGAVSEGVFSGLGTMRIPTADPEPETLLIDIAFPYNKEDGPFSEELASKVSWFKTATADYLGAFTADELSALDMDTVNRELLARYNSELRLGQIKELYILEYMRL